MIRTCDLLGEGETAAQFTKKALSSFEFFERRVMQRDFQPHHAQFFQDFYGKKRSVELAFRGSGKTTILGVDFPLFMACRDSFERKRRVSQSHMLFLITSSTQRQSFEVIRAINRAIQDYEFLNWLKPEGGGGRNVWTKRQLVLSNGCEIYSDVWGQNMRGRHITHALLDEASLYADKSVFYGVVEPMAAMYDGNIMAIGTPMSDYDLLAELAENTSGQYFVRKTPAVAEGTATWNAKYPLAKLESERERIGWTNYAREYLLQVTDTAERLIAPNDIAKCLDNKLDLENVAKEKGYYFLGVDLASSPSGDYTAVAVVEKAGKSCCLTHLNRFRGLDFQGHVGIVTEYHARYKPVSMLLDSSGFGKQLAEEVRRTEKISVDTFDFTAKNRMDALVNLGKMVSQGSLTIPNGKNNFTTSMVSILIHELSGIVPVKTKIGTLTYKSVTKHDDTVMALAMAALSANNTWCGETGAVGSVVIPTKRSSELDYSRKIPEDGMRKYDGGMVWVKPRKNYLLEIRK